jgi:pheromone shutdown protein TraB
MLYSVLLLSLLFGQVYGHLFMYTPIRSIVAYRVKESRSIQNQLSTISTHGVVSILSGPTHDVILIGTAHVSNQSAEIVRQVIPLLQPDTVIIELDQSRLSFVAKEMRTCYPYLIKKRSIITKLLSFSWAVLQLFNPFYWVGKILSRIILKAIGYKDLGLEEGGEFKAAILEAKRCNAELILGDRDYAITFDRAMTAASKSLGPIFTWLDELVKDKAPSNSTAETKESFLRRVELTMTRDKVNKDCKTFEERLPLVYEAIVGERDQYMAEVIANVSTKAKTVVVVVGLGHMAGMEKRLAKKNYKLIRYM